MSEISNYFDDLLDRVKNIKIDIGITIKKIKSEDDNKYNNKEDNSKKDKRIISSTKLEPMTRLRRDMNEIKNAQESPNTQFIIDKINDAFK